MNLASRRAGTLAVVLFAGITCVLTIYYWDRLSPFVKELSRVYWPNSTFTEELSTTPRRYNMTLAMVTCENRLELALTNLKSILAFSRASFRLIVYADPWNIRELKNRISKWPGDIRKRFTYDLRPVKFPEKNYNTWKHMFATCSTQRLFFPDMMPDEDAVIYLDADILLLRPVEELWSTFDLMHPSYLIAQAFEIEDWNTNPYRTLTKLPYFKPYGVNAGVMPMNLTRMRDFGWMSKLEPLLRKYGRRLQWGDQDIVNIVFNEHPDKLFVMPCNWNFRRDSCEFHRTCWGQAPALLHANRRLFTINDEPAFRSTQLAMREYKLGTSLERNFIDPLEQRLKESRVKTICHYRFLHYIKEWRLLAHQLDRERGLSATS
ncbi:unnamed protein product, partial [Ixodes hexagonus]